MQKIRLSDKLGDLKHLNHLTRPESTAARSNNSDGSHPPKMHSGCSGGGSSRPKPEPPNLTNELSFFGVRFSKFNKILAISDEINTKSGEISIGFG